MIGMLNEVLACSACLCILQGAGGTGLVSSQADVDNLTKNCTSVQGSIIIVRNYEGSFYLDGLSNITGIQTRQPRNRSKYNTGSGLTSIEIDGPAYIESLEIRDTLILRSISVPNTISIDRIVVGGAGSINSVTFGSLITASGISIQNVSQ
jgi:hypothetical protein